MKKTVSKSLAYFRDCGKRGGLKRARRLSRTERSLIASQAARKRWGHKNNFNGKHSIRLDDAKMDDPVYMEEILSEGSLEQWQNLYCEINNYPFGETAEALAQVLTGPQLYGITPLWKGVLASLRGAL